MSEFVNNDARRHFLKLVADQFLAVEQRPQLVLITHILPDRPPLIEALAEKLDLALIIAIPYSCNNAVFARLDQSYPMHRMELSDLLDEERLSDLIKSKVTSDFVVLEIGGYFCGAAANFVEANAPRALGIVEGTESGARRYFSEQIPRLPVVAMPMSSVKDAESRLIGDSCIFSLEKILRDIGTTQEPKTVFVNGFGRIGESVAKACRGRGYDVVVFDIDIERRLQAIASGYRVPERKHCLEQCDIVFGCSGTQSFSLDDLTHLRGRTYLVSATSKDVEFSFGELQKHIKFDTMPSKFARAELENSEILVINSGHPVNFIDGADVGFLLTLLQAEMLASIGAILASEVSPGVHPPSRARRLELSRLWFDAFVDPTEGWYKPT